MKKKLSFALTTLFLALAISIPELNACTDFVVKAKDGTIVNGRSMEFAAPMQSLAVVHPRGEFIQSSSPKGGKCLSWTTKYGFVTVTSMGKEGPNDGLSETGLSLGFLWYPETKYPDVSTENSSHAIEIMDMASWLLGNFATVDEVKLALKDIVVWGNKNAVLKSIPPLHIALHDASGKNLVVEFVDGKMNVHDNPIGVLTNAPSFSWQLTNLRNYANLTAVDVAPVKINGFTLFPTGHGAGQLGIPGDPTPPSRFVRTVFNTQLAAPVGDANGVVNLAQHILNAVDIPKGSDRLNNKTLEGDYTQWTVIKDMTHKVLYFRSYDDLSLKSIDLKKLNFKNGAPSMSVPIAGKSDGIGDVTSSLK